MVGMAYSENYSKSVSQGVQARHDAAVVMLLDEEPLPFEKGSFCWKSLELSDTMWNTSTIVDYSKCLL